jgi:AcrR family transcriptional regulator
MAPAPKTRDRIIQASLDLFNLQGERNITTNHIAAALGISPGNLYYHFRNKQAIIGELFRLYESQVDDILRLPEGRAVVLEDKVLYLEALLEVMWHYRFLHCNLEQLLENDAGLAQAYRGFARRCLRNAKAVYRSFIEAGILHMNDVQLEALTLNGWIVLTSWIRFLATAHASPDGLSEASLRRGIYQVLILEDGYLTDAARPAVAALYRTLYAPLEYS